MIEWLGVFGLDLSQWTDIGKKSHDQLHLWKKEPSSHYDQWALVVTEDDDGWSGMWEFRQCVLCGQMQTEEQAA